VTKVGCTCRRYGREADQCGYKHRAVSRTAAALTSAGWQVERRLDLELETIMTLRKFVIEREIPKVGSLEREQLRAAAQKSNEALTQLAPDIQWVESCPFGSRRA
jgi:hypothetical protein